MVNLMRLELQKLKVGNYMLSAAAITVLLALWCNTNIPDEDTLSYSDAFSSISSYVRSTFIVFSSVLMARMIIDEYRNKTISVLFMYPINRKKLLTAKLLLLSIWTFVILAAANGLVLAAFLLMDSQYGYIPETFSTSMIAPEIGRIVLYAAASTGLSLIPLFFGMLRKSVPATLVTSFVLALGFTGIHYDNWAKLFTLAASLVAVGIIMSYLAIRNVETADLLD